MIEDNSINKELTIDKIIPNKINILSDTIIKRKGVNTYTNINYANTCIDKNKLKYD